MATETSCARRVLLFPTSSELGLVVQLPFGLEALNLVEDPAGKIWLGDLVGKTWSADLIGKF